MKIFKPINIRVACLFFSLLLISSMVNSQTMISSSDNAAERTMSNCEASDYNFVITQGSDLQGCYYKIAFNLNWSVGNMPLCSPIPFPHGLYVSVAGANITGIGGQSSWFSGSNMVSGVNARYWNKQPLGTCSPLVNEILPNTPQSIKIYVATAATCTPVTISAAILNGNSWTSPAWAPPAIAGMLALPYKSYWDCGTQQTFNCASDWYSIGQPQTICKGTDLTLTLTGSMPSSSINPAWVTWYSYTPPSCTTPLVTVHPPASPWSVAQVGGLQFNTNAINTCMQYYAVINNGCNIFYSNPLKVTVCPSKPQATGTITSSPGYSLDALNHSCVSWSGKFTVAVTPSPCIPTITWWKRVNGGAWSSITLGSANSTTTPVQNFSLLGDGCNTKYDVQARLVNACDTKTVDFTVYIDKPSNGGTIATLTNMDWDIGTGTQTAPVLCYNTGTRLQLTIQCGVVQYWQYQEEATSCKGDYGAWTNVAGSGGTSVWWTNKLTKTRRYRAFVKNGACAGAFTANPIVVKVKPKLTVGIVASNILLCPTSTLTAKTSYGTYPCAYPVASYQWYLNGVAIAGANGATYTATLAGNYSVMVNDGKCGKATSSVIALCKPVLEITAPCCICDNSNPVDVTSICAVIKGNCGVAPTNWKWYKNGVLISQNAACISIQSSGTYKVTVQCGACILTQTVTIAPCK